MSRTRKDKPNKLLWGNYWDEPGPKKSRHTNTHWNWLQSTPSWWTRMMMNRPQRREAHLWEQEAAHTAIENLEELDTPNTTHKPHKYYY